MPSSAPDHDDHPVPGPVALDAGRRRDFLTRAERELSGALNLNRTWGLAARLAVSELAGQCGVTLRLDDGSVRTAVARTGVGVTIDVTGPPGAGPERVLATGLLEWHHPVDARTLCPPEIDMAAASVLLVPLATRGACFGVLTLVRTEPYEIGELELICDYADRVALALEAARLFERQLSASAELGPAPPPSTLPDIPGVRLAGAHRSAEAGSLFSGDFYQVIYSEAKGWLFALGDVCGKGLGAALRTSQVRRTLYAAAEIDTTPTETLELLNQTLLNTDDGRFVTLTTGRLAVREDGSVRVTLAGGGHLPPLILRRGGAVQTVQLAGMLVGAFAGARFDMTQVVLAPGDALFLYTDGVTEARDQDDQMYDAARVARDLAAYAGAPVGAVVERLEHLVMEHLQDGAHDDIAILGVQAWPAGG